MRSYRVCHRESGIAGCDARITQMEHLGPNRYELVRVVDYWVRVGPSRSREGPTHLCFSSCRAGVLPDSDSSMGSFSGYPPYMFVGQHRQPCMCLCANMQLLYDKQMHQ